ncbi:LOG family protein [Dankookia sp. P2]|uniref:LOG family protein n=1 Tax=Dankookia sp. P2 TaxID=3423955 RepID=UPI003D66AEDF
MIYGGGGVRADGRGGGRDDRRRRAGAWSDPGFLTRVERPHPDLAELEVTTSMHTRKTRMFELADAFVTLSGGLGTLDETVEIITWRQLGLHDKPVIILDINGWAQPLPSGGRGHDRAGLRRSQQPPALCGGSGRAGRARPVAGGTAAGHRCTAGTSLTPLALPRVGGYMPAPARHPPLRGGSPTDGA